MKKVLRHTRPVARISAAHYSQSHVNYGHYDPAKPIVPKRAPTRPGYLAFILSTTAVGKLHQSHPLRLSLLILFQALWRVALRSTSLPSKIATRLLRRRRRCVQALDLDMT